MSLNISYSDLKPRITELGEFIAQELDVNTSQVRQNHEHLIDIISYFLTNCLILLYIQIGA